MVDESINNYFEKLLVDNGYKIFEHSYNNSLRGFQKRMVDDIGIRYFISIYHYNHGRQIPNCDDYSDHYTFDVQFTLGENGKESTINFEFNGDFIHNEYRQPITLKEAEEHIYKVWKTMNYEYYEKY